MAHPLIRLVWKARDLPEARVVMRVLTAMLGIFVLIPVGTNVRRLGELSVTDWVGLTVFAAVGASLVYRALRGDAR